MPLHVPGSGPAALSSNLLLSHPDAGSGESEADRDRGSRGNLDKLAGSPDPSNLQDRRSGLHSSTKASRASKKLKSLFSFGSTSQAQLVR